MEYKKNSQRYCKSRVCIRLSSVFIMPLNSVKYCALAVAFFIFAPYRCVSGNFNDCQVRLSDIDVNAAESPLILNFQNEPFSYQNSQERPLSKILHPTYLDTECLIRNPYSNGALLGFSCPGHSLQFPGLEDWPDNVRATSLIGVHRGPAFDNVTLASPDHPSPISLDRMSAHVKCSLPIEPTMKQIDDGNYRVGYQMNALDFLPIYGLIYTDQLTFTHSKVLSINARRPRIEMNNESLRRGQIFKDLPDDASKLGSKSRLSTKLKEIFKSKINAGDDNYLVHGQILSKDDLFYIPEQRATLFLENTALMWNSINEGNWKKVGDIVRSLAVETATDLDVYSGTMGCLTLDKTPLQLYNLNNFTKHTCVPKFLFKIALDMKYNLQRGIVFVTINDPSIQVAEDASIASDLKLCNEKSECKQLYPEFSSTKKGYTYCCDLESFPAWNEIQNSNVEDKQNDVRPYYGPFVKVPPPIPAMAYPARAVPVPPPSPPHV